MAKHYPAWEMTRMVLQGREGKVNTDSFPAFLCPVAFLVLLHYAWQRRVEGGQGAAPPTGAAALASVTEELHLN